MKDSVLEALRHPISYTVGVVSSVAAVLHPSFLDALVATVWAQSGSIFGFTSLLGFSLGPRLEWLPSETWTYVAVGAGVLVLAKRGLGLYRSFTNELEERS